LSVFLFYDFLYIDDIGIGHDRFSYLQN